MEEIPEESQNCDTSCCRRNLVVLYEGDEFRDYLEYHAANYQLARNDISITLRDVRSNAIQAAQEGESLYRYMVDDTDGSSSLGGSSWDGAVFPGHMTGALREANQLWDWNDYLVRERNVLDGSEDDTGGIQWTDILPFYRSQAQQVDLSASNTKPTTGLLRGSSSSTTTTSSSSPWRSSPNSYQEVMERETLYAPLDGDMLVLFYRKDLFDGYNVKIPRTWDGYQDAASFFHGKPWGPNNATMIGSCVPKSRCSATKNVNAYWASLVLSTMTQTQGTSSGFLLDPETMEPILGGAMEETLKILEEEMDVGHPHELIDCATENDTTDMDRLFEEGNCALAYGWANQLTAAMININNGDTTIGVAPTPGSRKVLNRETGRLEFCTPSLCPYGTYYDDIGIVNRPSYSAFGGWVAGISNHSPTKTQRAMADFFSYLSNPAQSIPDALSSQQSQIVSPFRYSHTRASNWTDAGLSAITASQFTQTVQEINSGNTVSEIRINPGSAIRDILDEEVYDYLSREKGSLHAVPGDTERVIVAESIDGRIRKTISDLDTQTVMNNYQSSLGYSKSYIKGITMNYIEPNYRDTGWGVAVLICFMSLLVVFWALWNRNNKVMRAFQPFLVIQSAAGIFFMAATLIPLGFDDSLFGTEVLNVSCMAAPWIYIFGFTVFFSSIYSKIQSCINIYKHPGKFDRMGVRPKDSFKLFCKLFVVNGLILAMWTFLDPLKWYRLEKTSNGPMFPSPDGTVETYGSCRSENSRYLGFAIALYAFNMILSFIAMLQALKCRLLVLEYQQMQWLQLCILPFFEAWIIGGPVLTLMSERPTAQYVIFVIIIASTSIAAAFIIFAPEEWYVRKHSLMCLENKLEMSSSTYPLGVRVLKHPKVESQKHVLKLQKNLVHYTTANTELSIDIRVLHEKFRLLTEKEKLDVVKGFLAREVSDSELFRIKANMAQEDDLFESSSVGRPRRGSGISQQMPSEDEDEKKIEADTALARGLIAGSKQDEEERAQGETRDYHVLLHDQSRTGPGGDSGNVVESVNSSSTGSVRSPKKNIREKLDEDFKRKHSPQERRNSLATTRSARSGSSRSVVVEHPLAGDIVIELEDDEYLGPHDDFIATRRGSNRSGNSRSMVVEHPLCGNIVIEIPDEEIDHDSKIEKRRSGSPDSSGENSASFGSDEEAPKTSNENQNRTSKIAFTAEICDEIEELEELDKIIEADNLEQLESEAMMIAEQFKLNRTLLESISDLQVNNDEEEETNFKDDGVHNVDIVNISAIPIMDVTKNGTKDLEMQPDFPRQDKRDSLDPDQVPSASAGESSGRPIVGSEEKSLKESSEHSVQQLAGEPSSDRSIPLEQQKTSISDMDVLYTGASNNGNSSGMLNPSTQIRHERSRTPPMDQECGTTSSLHSSGSSSTPSALPPETLDSEMESVERTSESKLNAVQSEGGSFSIGGWAAAGAIGNLLAEGSDSTSVSSFAESRTESLSSLVITSPEEIDELLDHSDFNAVKVAAQGYGDPTSNEQKEMPPKNISATRQKKRELEAMMSSLRRPDHS